MFRGLAMNTAISAVAYFVVSVVGLLVVPMLVSAYGLAEFGLIVLVRLLLPTGILGPFDCGFSETATQAVARARTDGSWSQAQTRVRQLLVIAAAVGASLAATVFLGAQALAVLLKVDAAHLTSFVITVQVTAMCLPVLFPALVFEGVIKGAEAYRALRAVEVLAALAYGAAAVVAVAAGWGYHSVALGFLLSLLLRAGLAVVLGLQHLCARPVCDANWWRGSWREVLLRCRLMAWNRTLGTSQAQAAPLLIGVLLGPAAAGLYDVLVRLPRFAKQIVGLLNSALLPVAARLEADADHRGMQRLGRLGLVVAAAAALPPLAAGSVFSEPILRLWIGPALASEWPWLALMFAVPALSALISSGATALLVRTECVAAMNRLVAIQIVLQLGLSLALLAYWEVRAFIFGQVAAMVLTFGPQLRLICREQGLGRETMRTFAVVVGIVAVAMILVVVTGLPGKVGGPATLVFALGGSTVVCWLMLAWVLLSRAQWAALGAACPWGRCGDRVSVGGDGAGDAARFNRKSLLKDGG